MKNSDFIKIEEFRNSIVELEHGYSSLMNHLYNTKAGEPSCCKKYNFAYFRINEIGYETKESNTNEILYALYAARIPFSIIFKCIEGVLEIFIGTNMEFITSLYSILNGTFYVNSFEMEVEGRSKLELYANREVFNQDYFYGGIIKGEIKKKKENYEEKSVIDAILCGVRKQSFSIVVTARPFERKDILTLINNWSELKTRGEIIKTRQVSVHDDLNSVSYTDMSHKVSNYLDIVDRYCTIYNEALGEGLWEACIKYYTRDDVISKAISGIMISKLFSNESAEAVHSLEFPALNFDDILFEDRTKVNVDNGPPMLFPTYSNFLSSDELSAVIELPKFDTMGVSVRNNVRFDLSQNNYGDTDIGEILQEKRKTGKAYLLDVNELNRHALVVGLTGGGKTNTLKCILMEIHNKHAEIPFLIIEPAKREYWELYKLGCEPLKIYSIGSHYNNLKMNPFQKCGNISIQTHIDYVFAAFKASFIMYPPMPYVLERAIYSIYEDCGWDIENDRNVLGEVFPTLEQLYLKIPYTVTEMGYDQREQKNIVGALQARINSLRLGTKGQCLNVKRSYPIECLLHENTIIELENIGDEEAKAFLMSLILIQVSEYRMGCEDAQKELRHLILFEEAHRLLKNIPAGSGENADPRGNAVEMFCNMLAELRSKGQGFIIADQIPSKLAVDIIKNTNLKIVHRIVAEEDRSLVGRSMHMTEEQMDHLSTLSQGVGAVYSEGDYMPKLVKAAYAGKWLIEERKEISYREVLERCGNVDKSAVSGNQKKLDMICALCPFDCEGKHLEKMYKHIRREELEKFADRLGQNFDKGMFTVVIGECLIELRDEDSECYWSYAFCCAKEIMEYLNVSKEIKYRIFMDLLQLLSCMGGAPSSWKER